MSAHALATDPDATSASDAPVSPSALAVAGVPVQIAALDGRVLSGNVFEPRSPRAAAIFFPALGVPQRHYARFASWLASRGVASLTFDYRGCGASRDRSPRRDPATLLDWARLDAAGAVDFALARWRGLPKTGVGHSFGGQLLGLTPRALDLDRLAIVASGSGDMTLYPPALAARYRLLLGAAVPAIAAVAGYIPGRLGLGEDLPAGVVLQWSRWCHTPGYVTGALPPEDLHFHRIEAPLWFAEMPGDTYSPPKASAALRSWFTRAKLTWRPVAAEEVGGAKIGHFGFFRGGPAERIWPELLAHVL